MRSIPSAAVTTDFVLTRSSGFDWLFVAFGAVPFVLPFALWMGEGQLSSTHPIYFYFWMNALISSPHVYATYVRLGRKIKEGRAGSWLGVPAYFAIVGLLASAKASGFFLEAMTFVNVVQSYHYWRQGYGVQCFLSKRSGRRDPAAMRGTFLAFHLAAPLMILGRWDTIYTAWGGKPSEFILPVDIPDPIITVCWILAVTGLAAGIASELRNLKEQPARYDFIALASLLALFSVHAYGFLSVEHFQRGFFVVTMFHAVQYLAMVWVFEKEQPVGVFFSKLSFQKGALAFPLFWGGIFAVAYVLENHVAMSINSAVPYAATVLLSSVSAHHYLVDSFIWKREAGA